MSEPAGGSAKALAPKKAKRTWRRRVVVWSARVAVLAVVLLAGLYFTRERTVFPFALRFARGWVERELGAELEVDALHSDLWRYVRLEGVRWSCERDEMPLRELEVQTLEVTVDLLAWLREPDLLAAEFAGLRSVRGHADRIVIDTRGGSDEPQEAGGPVRLPQAPLPTVDLSVDWLEVVLADTDRISMRESRVETRPGDWSSISVESAELAVLMAGFERSEPLAIRAQVGRETSTPEVVQRLGLERLAWGADVQMEEGELGWSPASGLELAAAWQLLGAQGRVDVSLVGERCAGDFTWNAVQLDRVRAVLPEAQRDPLSSLDGELSGDLRFDLDLSDPLRAKADLNLIAARARYHGVSVPRARATVSVEDGGVTRGDVRIERAGDHVHLRELTLPSLDLEPWEWLRSATAEIDVQLRDPSSLALFDPLLPGNEDGSKAQPVRSVVLGAQLEGGDLLLSGLALAFPSGTVRSERGEVRIAESLERWMEDSRVDIDLAVDMGDLRDFNAFVGTLDWSGSLNGRIEVDGSPAAPTGRIEVAASDLLVAGFPIGALSVRADADGRSLAVREALADGDVLDVTGSGVWNFASRSIEGLELSGGVAALEQLGVPGLAAGSVSGTVRADGPIAALRGRLEIRGDNVIAFERPLRSLELDASFTGPSAQVEHCLVATDDSAIELAGEASWDANGWNVELADLSAASAGGTLVLADVVRATGSGGEWTVEPFRLEGSGGAATCSASLGAERIDLRLLFEEFDPMPLLRAGLDGELVARGLDGEVTLLREPERIEWSADLALAEFRTAPSAELWSAAVKGSWQDGVLQLVECSGQGPGLGRFSASARAPLDWREGLVLGEGPFELDVFARAELAELPIDSPVSGAVALELDVDGDWDSWAGGLTMTGQRLLAHSTEQSFGPADLSLALTMGERAEVSRGRVFSEQFSFDLSGGVGLLSPRDLWEGRGATWLEEQLDVRAEFEIRDPGWIATMTDAVGRLEGQYSGELTARGALSAPEVSGRLDIAGGSARISGGIPVLEAIEGAALLEGKRVTLEGLRGEYGAAPFQLDGEFTWEGEVPRVDARVRGTDVLLARSRGTLVRADVDVTVEGPLEAREGADERLRASGEVTLTDGRWVRSIDLLGDLLRGGSSPPSVRRGLEFSISREAPISEMELDIAVRSRDAFVIKNNLISGGVRPDLRMAGTGEVPYLVGKVYLDPTRVSLPSGNLRIRSGTIEFLRANAAIPKLALVGESRVKGYDLEVQVTGDLTEADVRVTATPPLSNEEAAILLLTGQIPEDANSRTAGRAVAVYFAQDLLNRWLADESTEAGESFLDRLDIEIGSDISRGGSETMHVMYRLNPLPRGGSGEGQVRFLTGEQDIYDRVNFGYRFLFKFR